MLECLHSVHEKNGRCIAIEKASIVPIQIQSLFRFIIFLMTIYLNYEEDVVHIVL